MAELKTKATDADVEKFLKSITDEQRKTECITILDLMKKVTKEQPKMWGAAMVGFGSYKYKYDTGREGEWFITGFSPRKANLTLYIMPGFERYDELLAKLGKHKTGKSCLYINKLEDIDIKVLKELVAEGYKTMKKKYS